MKIPDEEPLDTNMTEMMSRPLELNAGLPKDFSGNSKDSNRWMLSLQAYFEMNSSVYNDKAKLLTAPIDLSFGKEAPGRKASKSSCNSATLMILTMHGN